MKKTIYVCVVVMKRCSTKSSALVLSAVMPRPPRRWLRYVVSGQPFDVTVMGQGNDDVLFGDEILDIEVLVRRRR